MTRFSWIFAPLKLHKILILGAIALFASIGIHGCSGFSQKLQPLRIGISSWPGFDIVLYAQEAGLLEQRGLEVELVRFESQQDSMRAMMRGSLDAVFSSLWDTMQKDPRHGRVVREDVEINSDPVTNAIAQWQP